MDIAPFNAPVFAKGWAQVIKSREGLDMAARHFVYKLYDTTDGQLRRCLPVSVRIKSSPATTTKPIDRSN